MGPDAWFEVVPAREYAKYRKGPEHYVSAGAPRRYELFREWSECDEAFTRIGRPLNLAIRGNRPTMAEFDEDWGGAYEAYVTPALVKEINRSLENLTDKAFVLEVKEARRARAQEYPPAIRRKMAALRKYEEKYFTGALRTVKAAYRAAAKQGAYLRIFIC